MGRLLAIDYGTKRVGLAVSDPLQMIASALSTVHPEQVFSFLKDYTTRETVDAFIVGWPRRLDNSATNNTPHVIGFGRKLVQTFPQIPVYWIDERFTSAMAMQAMISAGSSKKQRQQKENIDMLSATIILQSFMEQRAAGVPPRSTPPELSF